MSQFQVEYIKILIDDYGLDLEGIQAEMIVATWIQEYDPDWVVKAIVEVIFRGVYKVKTVDGILRQWQRSGKIICHFKADFERETLKKYLAAEQQAAADQAQASQFVNPANESAVDRPGLNMPILDGEYLNPDELAPFHHHHPITPKVRQFQPRNMPNLTAETEDGDPDGSIVPQQLIESQPLPPRLRLLSQLKDAIAGAADTDMLVAGGGSNQESDNSLQPESPPVETVQQPYYVRPFYGEHGSELSS